MTAAGLAMFDSQVHLVRPNVRERPWPSNSELFHGRREFGVDQLLGEMNAAGVARAVIVPTTAVDGFYNDFALSAAHAHPGRFSVVGLVDLKDQASARALLGKWTSIEGLAGLRVIFRHAVGDSIRWLMDGTADWFWPAAEAAGVPLYVHAPGQLALIGKIAQDHPRLRLAIDHLGMSGDVLPEEVDSSISDLVLLARHPNVCVKASALACITPAKFPAARLRSRMEEVLAQFGPARVFWGSDITRIPGSYKEAIEMFLESVSFLRADEIRLVMGESLAGWLGAARDHA